METVAIYNGIGLETGKPRYVRIQYDKALNDYVCEVRQGPLRDVSHISCTRSKVRVMQTAKAQFSSFKRIR